MQSYATFPTGGKPNSSINEFYILGKGEFRTTTSSAQPLLSQLSPESDGHIMIQRPSRIISTNWLERTIRSHGFSTIWISSENYWNLLRNQEHLLLRILFKRKNREFRQLMIVFQGKSLVFQAVCPPF